MEIVKLIILKPFLCSELCEVTPYNSESQTSYRVLHVGPQGPILVILELSLKNQVFVFFKIQ